MTNKEIVEAFPNINIFIECRNLAEDNIERAIIERDRYDKILKTLARVSFIHNGVAIYEHGQYNLGEVVGDRYAQYYLNQHNMKTYGVYLYSRNAHETRLGSFNQKLCGVNFTKAKARQICLDWVADDKIPA